MDPPSSRSSTPPQHPIYNVSLTSGTIADILSLCVPDFPRSHHVSPLHHDRCWNNRIYMIGQDGTALPCFVLKVNGKQWGAAKVENEVLCLLLLQQYCPTIPVLRIIAWSCNGADVVKYDVGLPSETPSVRLPRGGSTHGWILMSCLPGEPLAAQPLSTEQGKQLAKQVAEMIVRWRQQIPKSRLCGNLRVRSSNADLPILRSFGDGTSPGLGFNIRGLLTAQADLPGPMSTLLSYWHTKLSCARELLSTEAVFQSNRNSVTPVPEHFLVNTLPRLAIFQDAHEDSSGFVFSHTDLQPRNVLVSRFDTHPQLMVTGIVDFEFAGFFPLTEDFTGKSIVPEEVDEEGWSKELYDEILSNLEKAGEVTAPIDRVATSHSHSTEMNKWEQLELLGRLETHIAPWWLPEEVTKGTAQEEIDKELNHARMMVTSAIQKLHATVGTSVA